MTSPNAEKRVENTARIEVRGVWKFDEMLVVTERQTEPKSNS